MKKLLFIAMSLLLLGCSNTNFNDDEYYFKFTDIENVIDFYSRTAEEEKFYLQFADNKMASRDYRGQVLTCLKGITFEETNESFNNKESIFVYNPDNNYSFFLSSTANIIQTQYFYRNKNYHRYYKIDADSKDKIINVATQSLEEYKELTKADSTRGNLDDYYDCLNHYPNYQPAFKVWGREPYTNKYSSWIDNDFEILKSIKSSNHLMVDEININEDSKAIVKYNIGSTIKRFGYGWTYNLFDDYESVELLFQHYIYGVEERDDNIITSRFLYKISEEEGCWIYKTANRFGK